MVTQEEAKDLRYRQNNGDASNPYFWDSHKNTKLYNYAVYANEIAQAHIGPKFVASVSLSFYQSCLTDSVVCVLLKFSSSLDFMIHLTPLLQGSPGSASSLSVPLCIFYQLLDDIPLMTISSANYWSMSTTHYH